MKLCAMPRCPAPVSTLIGSGEVLDVRLVAKGVEWAAEAAWLRVRGIAHPQGCYFACPVLEALPSVTPEPLAIIRAYARM